MDRKLLFFDIDGTLLAGGVEGYIPENVISALKQAQKNGHYLFINSGRTYDFMPDLIKEFPFDGYICGCGTQIVFHNETLYHHKIPKEIRHGLEAILLKARIQGAYEGPHYCYFDVDEKIFPEMKMLRTVYANINGEHRMRSFSDPDLDFDKFVIFYNEKSDLPFFKDHIKDHFTFIKRESFGKFNFAEIVPKNCSKATGIDYLCDYLGLSLKDCYAFGDSTNDLTMLEHVPHSIGMGNSYPEVLDRVSYITTPVDRDGIVVALKHFKLI